MKKALIVFLVFCLLIPFTVYAEDEYHDLKYYQDFMYEHSSSEWWLSSGYYKGIGTVIGYVDVEKDRKLLRIYYITVDEPEATHSTVYGYDDLTLIVLRAVYNKVDIEANRQERNYYRAEIGDKLQFIGWLNRGYSGYLLLNFRADMIELITDENN